ncbi:MAG TPA: DUF554 domain-containing protein [Lachnospiraceae bacterium]|nr:DUF554 domain-containing protein [Lachnospiraceae bacterium]HPF29044.1 DUF554 domain-containing protein [Lachnospiraceae bacterium]
MTGLGTIINVGAIVVAGLGGSLFGKALKKQMQDTLMKACGLCVIFLGIGGSLTEMLQINQDKLVSSGSMMMIGCFILGSIVGELLDIELRLEQFGQWLKVKTKSEGESGFVAGFVDTSLIVCIGAMAIVGAIEDGITGDYSLLTAKSVLDFIIVFVMTSSRGKGCIFSAIPVGILQGTVTILAKVIEPIMTTQALSNLSLIGSMMIFCVGVNLIWGKKIKAANMLPALIVTVIWALVTG